MRERDRLQHLLFITRVMQGGVGHIFFRNLLQEHSALRRGTNHQQRLLWKSSAYVMAGAHVCKRGNWVLFLFADNKNPKAVKLEPYFKFPVPVCFQSVALFTPPTYNFLFISREIWTRITRYLFSIFIGKTSRTSLAPFVPLSYPTSLIQLQ